MPQITEVPVAPLLTAPTAWGGPLDGQPLHLRPGCHGLVVWADNWDTILGAYLPDPARPDRLRWQETER